MIKPILSLAFLFWLSIPVKGQFRPVSEKEFSAFLKRTMDSLQMPGISIAIIQDGKIAYHQAVGLANAETKTPVNEQSIFEAASLSKPAFAYFALKMAEKGIIDLDRPLYFYLPDSTMERDQRYKQVTARMVLCHTTGFPNWRYFDLADSSLHVKPGDFYIKSDPGKQFSYSGEAYHYLARVLAHNNYMNSEELSQLFRKEVASPLKMQHAYFTWDDYLYDHKVTAHRKGKAIARVWGSGLPSDHSKVFNAAGSLHTEAVSYAHFVIALMNEEGLRPSTFKELFREQVQIPVTHSNYINDGATAWGLGLTITRTDKTVKYSHGGNNGGFQSGFAFYKEPRNGYVFFTNSDKGREFKKELELFLSR